MTGITPAGAGKTTGIIRLPHRKKDHPRRCGENSAFSYSSLCFLGSPPQVRGKLKNCSLRRTAWRITPAGAGKTCRRWSGRYMRPDHPRRCGENRQVLPGAGLQRGSPPQVRGKLSSLFALSILDRITPAGAGKTYMNRIRGCTEKDHPRRCGENKTC